MDPTLNYQIVRGSTSTPDKSVLILHGILGSGKNWRGFCRRFAEAAPDWQFVLPDLRHHGESVGFDGPHTVQACVEDLEALCHVLGLSPRVIVGHSFGGKVALKLAAQASWPVSSVWALDTPPGLRGAGARGPGSEVGHVLATLRSVPTPASSRARVDEVLTGAGFSPAMRGWMTTNLKSVDGGVDWRFNLDAVEALINDYFECDLWPALRAWSKDAHVHLLAAERGGRWSAHDRTQAKACERSGTLSYHLLRDAGHWVHVDAPEALRRILGADLDGVACKMARRTGRG